MGFVTPAQGFDVITVGDMGTDVFIPLPEGSVEARDDATGKWLEIPLGAKLPYEPATTAQAGGSAANVAVGLARLSLRVAIASFVGYDEIGRDLVAALHTEEIDTRLVHIDVSRTNRNFVLLYRGQRTILDWHEEYEYHWPHLRPSEVPAWLYLTSLAENARAYENQIADWLDEKPDVRLVVQPGTLQIKEGPERLMRLIARSELFICDYLQAASLVGGQSENIGALIEPLHRLGGRRVIVIGEGGSATASDGRHRFVVPAYPDPVAPLDRTGAEDAFSAAVVAALVHGLSFNEALYWGPVNFMSVSHQMGSQAGLLREDALRAHLETLVDAFVVRGDESQS